MATRGRATHTDYLTKLVRSGHAPADSLPGILISHRGRVVDAGYTADAHVVRELYIDGHMIGFRQSWRALERLARAYVSADEHERLAMIERENLRPYPAPLHLHRKA